MSIAIGAHVDQTDPIAEAQARGMSHVQFFLGDPQSYKGPVFRYAGGADGLRADAEAAGVAEGTIFRVFGDKETLLREAGDAYLDPAPLRARLRELDATLTLEEKIGSILKVLRERFHGVISIMSALGYTDSEPPHLRNRSPEQGRGYASIVS